MAAFCLKFFTISLIILTSLTCIAVIVLSAMDLNYIPLIESSVCLAVEILAGVGAAFEIVPLIAVVVMYLTLSTVIRMMMFLIGTILYKMKYSPYQFSNIFLAATIIYGASVILHFMSMTSLCLIVDFKRRKETKLLKSKATGESTTSNQTKTTVVGDSKND